MIGSIDTVYLVPGRGNRLSDIGNIVSNCGYDVYGREVISPFASMALSEQLEVLANDITSSFWYAEAKIIGHSYGGYLLLHTLSELEPFPGDILLLSPVLGPAIDRDRRYISYPPRADKLLSLAEQGKLPAPRYLEIHSGSDDNGCNPELANEIGRYISAARVHIVRNQGHELSESYMRQAIYEFLNPGGV